MPWGRLAIEFLQLFALYTGVVFYFAALWYLATHKI